MRRTSNAEGFVGAKERWRATRSGKDPREASRHGKGLAAEREKPATAG